MKSEKIIFFRNDDVRGTLDRTLIKLTNIFINHNIPISHAVEPANVTDEVVSWLMEGKKRHPDLIEIVQHGYKHKLNFNREIRGKLKKGEFGGMRTYKEQFDEISKGKELMDKLFGNQWFPLFTFPYNTRNETAIQAVSDAGFLAVNGNLETTLKHRIGNLIGRLLRKKIFAQRVISWNLKYIPKTNLFQIDTSISVIKKYFDENSNCEHRSLGDLKNHVLELIKKVNNIGFVLHHRYETDETLKILEDLIIWLKIMNNLSFSTQEEIYKKFAR